jgi:hypothetical protein
MLSLIYDHSNAAIPLFCGAYAAGWSGCFTAIRDPHPASNAGPGDTIISGLCALFWPLYVITGLVRRACER